MSDRVYAKVIADSISYVGNKKGERVTTLELMFPRIILSEFNTHRVFSRNASSSRAIPTKKIIDDISSGYFKPDEWIENTPRMGGDKGITGWRKTAIEFLWGLHCKVNCWFARRYNGLGLHKQYANRCLETFGWSRVIVTSAHWDNFFHLRNHPAAQPEIHELARKIKDAIDASTPVDLKEGEWHLPYVTESEKMRYDIEAQRIISVARCARVSYKSNATGKNSEYEEDLELFNRLVTRPYTDKFGVKWEKGEPRHMSPVEHQVTPAKTKTMSGNLDGHWLQYRKWLEKNG